MEDRHPAWLVAISAVGSLAILGCSSNSTSSSPSTGSASSSSSASCAPADPLDGPPVSAEANRWTWVPVPESRCRDGSPTGFGIRVSPASTKLFIYLEGGGACFNAATCARNPSTYGSADFASWQGGSLGIFDTTNAANPLRDWNAVYVPYCTGDIHGGDATGVDVPNGPRGQSFVGYANLGHYLRRIVPTFPGVTEVLLTGISAGGFGALYNYDRVARDFCPAPVVLLDDSGPPMSDTYLAPCLQRRWRMLWNLDATLPPDCPLATAPDGGGLVSAITCLGSKYASARLGMISSDRDTTTSYYYGFGQSDCAGLDGPPKPLPAATFAAGLAELRSVYMSKSPSWGSYFVPSTSHTYLYGPFFRTTVGGVPLTTWVGDLVDGGPIRTVGP